MASSSSLRSVPHTQDRYEYAMLLAKDDDDAEDFIELVGNLPEDEEVDVEQLEVEEPVVISWKQQAAIDLGPSQDRETYFGALAFNFCAFILPALYATLSKLWVANIDASMVVTTDSYAYIGVFAEILNQGLPRASYLIIGNKSQRSFRERLQLTHTLILFQSVMGLIMSMAFVAGATTFADGFVPAEVRAASVTYVRISAFSVFSSAVEYSANAATRALDKPEVPLIISSTRFVINILLDLLLISKIHATGVTPTVNMQASIQLVCNLASAIAGLAYFVYMTTFSPQSALHTDETGQNTGPSLTALLTLFKPGAVFFLESLIRNLLYLWIIHNIISMGSTYATAWGVFTTIRSGVIGVPVMAAEATTLTFTGHSWGSLRATLAETSSSQEAEEGTSSPASPRISTRQLWAITRWSSYSILLLLIIQIPLSILMSAYTTLPFARYLSGSVDVARIALHMWRTISWCYVLFGLADQLAAILVATRPHWYLYQSLVTNVLYVLPWAIACQVAELEPDHAWTYHGFVFGGSLVFAFFVVVGSVGLWVVRLKGGKEGVGK